MRNLLQGMLVMWTVALLFQAEAIAQQKGKLVIGDVAPAVKYSKWIKGTPTSLEGDQLYVLEFWATWCGPCKAAMPHLTKLQQEYKDKVTFIGVGVWEKVPEGKPYESSLPAVEKFVKGNDANMGYSVIADNNEQYMGNNWLKAAGENGIPSTFVIKNKKILWIGHPNALDSILPKIMNGSYDMQAFKAKFEKTAEAGRNMAARMASMFKPIEDAIKAKEYKKAFDLMDKMAAEQPTYKMAMEGMKFRVLLNNVGEKQAIEYAKEWQKTNKSANGMILGEIYNKDGFSKETYLWAASIFGDPDLSANPVLLDALATCFAKGGDYKKAAVSQERAVELAAKALKDGTMVGSVMDYTVKEYMEKLKQYKSMK